MTAIEITIRPLRESELPEADRIYRLAFGTFIGLPDPMRFAGDADYVKTRWLADPASALGAEFAGELIGSNFLTNWGSVGFFGPLTIRPDFWDKGVARRLLSPTMDIFAEWGTKLTGLYTFAQSAKHVHLYQKFGFWPQFLTAIMTKPVDQTLTASSWSRFSEMAGQERDGCLKTCAELTGAIYEGLNVEREICAVAEQRLGETVLVLDGSRLAGFAVCHCGAGSEAGSGALYIKFGASRPGLAAEQNFRRLLEACEAFAASRGLEKLVAGVNTARVAAYRQMLARGFRALTQGVTMLRSEDQGYNRPDVYVIDDWR
jgi:GNAT superfamily N-acetyltransferase